MGTRFGFGRIVGFCLLVVTLTEGVWAQTPASQQVRSLLRAGTLPRPTQMHGAAVVGKRLYVLGGHAAPNTWLDEVISAEIQDNGQLGPWRQEQPMPERRSYIANSVEVVNNRIYVVGGGIQAAANAPERDLKPTQEVLWTTVQADGTLAPWTKSTPFPGEKRLCLATCSTEKQLFVLGGTNAKTVLDGILVADLAADGAPTNWRESAKLPRSLWFEGGAILEGRMYVWGGLFTRQNTDANEKVFSAEVGKDGRLGTWSEELQMSAPVYSSGFCGFNDYLLCIAGRYKGGAPSDVVWFGHLKDKRLENWNFVKTDLETRTFHALGIDKARGWVFVVGGRFRGEQASAGGRLVNVVQAFQLPQSADSHLNLAQAVAAAATQPQAGADVPMLSLDQALAKASGTPKKTLVFFYSSQVPACKRFWDGVIKTPGFASLTKDYILAGVDTGGKDVSYCYKYGIFRVPCMVVLSSDAKLLSTSGRLEKLEDVQQFLSGAQGK